MAKNEETWIKILENDLFLFRRDLLLGQDYKNGYRLTEDDKLNIISCIQKLEQKIIILKNKGLEQNIVKETLIKELEMGVI